MEKRKTLKIQKYTAEFIAGGKLKEREIQQKKDAYTQTRKCVRAKVHLRVSL